jgi:hypothetical protein
LSIGQIEGIAVDETGIYISGEKFKSPLGSTKPSLYFIPKDQLKINFLLKLSEKNYLCEN